MSPTKRDVRRNRTVVVGAVLDTVLARYHLYDGVFLSKLAANREEVFGPYFGIHLTPTEFKEGRLTVKVDNDAWRHEAELCRPDLLKRLAEYAPGKVKKLFFV